MEGMVATLERRRVPWTVKELANVLNVSGRYLYRQVEKRRIQCVRFGAAIRFEPKDVLDWYSAKIKR
jgi:excisionase family DNA binding protein